LFPSQSRKKGGETRLPRRGGRKAVPLDEACPKKGREGQFKNVIPGEGKRPIDLCHAAGKRKKNFPPQVVRLRGEGWRPVLLLQRPYDAYEPNAAQEKKREAVPRET